MKLKNATRMEAGYTMGAQPNGRELLIVVVKGTFSIPPHDQEPLLAEKQVPLVETDVFTGEPGFSAPLHEMDFAPHKLYCDVLLNGKAYAPGGKPTKRAIVSLSVGSWKKSFYVVGNRKWESGALKTHATEPVPFTIMPISYNNAFGGVDRSRENEKEHKYFIENLAGVGYQEHLDKKSLDGKAMPNTEEVDNPVTHPNRKYRPMAFGPVGRGWGQRIQYAGTYDQHWMDNVYPFLPPDFNDRYYQAAPADQWIPYPAGGERVELLNLIPQGRVAFQLPAEKLQFEFLYKNGELKRLNGVIDTLLLEPELGHFTMSWRANLPLRKNLHEIELVVAGSVPQEENCDYYKSVDELEQASRERGECL